MKKNTEVFKSLNDYTKWMDNAMYKTIIAVFVFEDNIVVTYMETPPLM